MMKISLPEPMKLITRWLLAVCVATLGGFLAGAGLYITSSMISPRYSVYLPLGDWELALTPPFKAAQLSAYQRGHLFLKTANGTLYSCDPSTKKCSQASYIPEASYRLCGEPGSLTPLRPGKVVSSLAIRGCDPETYVDTHFVLIDNGTVWKWQRWWSQPKVHRTLGAWALYGGLLGALGSVTVLWRRSHWYQWIGREKLNSHARYE